MHVGRGFLVCTPQTRLVPSSQPLAHTSCRTSSRLFVVVSDPQASPSSGHPPAAPQAPARGASACPHPSRTTMVVVVMTTTRRTATVTTRTMKTSQTPSATGRAHTSTSRRTHHAAETVTARPAPENVSVSACSVCEKPKPNPPVCVCDQTAAEWDCVRMMVDALLCKDWTGMQWMCSLDLLRATSHSNNTH